MTLSDDIAALRGRLTADASETMDEQLLAAIARQIAKTCAEDCPHTEPVLLTEDKLADLFQVAILTFWSMLEHSPVLTKQPRPEPPRSQ
jgi:hypothetical protein